jgi:hypothetical protein
MYLRGTAAARNRMGGQMNDEKIPVRVTSSGQTLHVVVAEEYRRVVVRAKHRRLEYGPWALVYVPRVDGPSFRLYRRDLDPWLTEDVAGSEPDALRDMVRRFHEEMRAVGEAPER